MKKRIVSGFVALSAFALVGGALAGQQFNEARADEETIRDKVVTLLANYHTEHVYTKKTEIFLSEAAKVDLDAAGAFHAHETRLKRATYYDESVDGLLMGDYDGGFADINSGYVSEGEDMEHYRYTGETSETADYFAKKNVNYTVKGTTPNAYFVNLTNLSNAIDVATSCNWTQDANSAYYYDFQEQYWDSEKGEYSDPLLKDLQYFVAPMLLQGNFAAYFTFHHVQIQETEKWLTIRLYVTGTDAEKVTLIGGEYGVLAEARIFKGIQIGEPLTRCVVKGSFNEWGDGIPMAYYPAYGDVEQYRLTVDWDERTQFKVVCGGEWYGYETLENGDLFWNGAGGNIEPKYYATEYTIYWKATLKTMYIASDFKAITINVPSGWAYGERATRIYCWTADGETNTEHIEWPGIVVHQDDTTCTTYIPADTTHIKLVDAWESGWVENQTVDIELKGASSITINSWQNAPDAMDDITLG